MNELETAIDKIPSGEWWKRSTRATFLKVAQQMIDSGIPQEKTVSLLEEIYLACNNEF